MRARTAPVHLLLLNAALAGCAAPSGPIFRDPSVSIASTTRFDPARLEGPWARVAAFSPDSLAPGCPEIGFTRQAGAMQVVACPGLPPVAHRIDPLGRLVPAEGPPLWILWVDEGFRTAVVGTPDGSLGWILERSGATPPDRLAAAREVLAFNGYDPAALLLR